MLTRPPTSLCWEPYSWIEDYEFNVSIVQKVHQERLQAKIR